MTTSCCPSLTDKARPTSLEVGKEREGAVAGELGLWGWGRLGGPHSSYALACSSLVPPPALPAGGARAWGRLGLRGEAAAAGPSLLGAETWLSPHQPGRR